jgi:hypothetical protein
MTTTNNEEKKFCSFCGLQTKDYGALADIGRDALMYTHTICANKILVRAKELKWQVRVVGFKAWTLSKPFKERSWNKMKKLNPVDIQDIANILEQHEKRITDAELRNTTVALFYVEQCLRIAKNSNTIAEIETRIEGLRCELKENSVK